ncbi:hypothetical protein DMB66_35520 [Actinoplanes sp. ATCC 53533]|uniref:hypothetical protein n=1 Tax=Actinoplanes sp. ATCC 53533 TaxID=1288362 RepID=UPI000F76CBEB|nr:hypothetical protein [Actinoplanes sp. ATCC 53533]RSM55624.1 hypothetical protein DMB66_35520 [Actinoplanes sp. ATCC 53533]
MSIGSLSSSTVSTATLASADTAAQAAKAREAAEAPTIADHVAADGDREPVRSASTTLGTLVDTYL